MSQQRLQKILSRAGVASRRDVEDMIRDGRVTLNGQVAGLGDQADLAVDAVKVDGKRIQPLARPHRYLLVNKPPGYVSTLDDPEGRPKVLDLVPQRLHPALVAVGRLDYDSEGLLLLTDDGELALHVAHPRFGCSKTYEVKVKGRPSEEEIEKLRGGIRLDGRRTVPARISRRARPGGARDSVSNTWWTVVLHEGRTRQVREMFFRIGHPVARLRRVAIGPITDAGLPLGAWRELTAVEVETLRQRTEQPRRPRKPPAKPRSPAPARKPGSRAEGARPRKAAEKPSPDRPRRKPGSRPEGVPAKPRPSASARKPGSRAEGARPRKAAEKSSPDRPRRKPGSRPEGARPAARKPAAGGPRRQPGSRPEGSRPPARKPSAGGPRRQPGSRPEGSRPPARKPAADRPRRQPSPRKPEAPFADRPRRKPLPIDAPETLPPRRPRKPGAGPSGARSGRPPRRGGDGGRRSS